jgi:hypothetical protein
VVARVLATTSSTVQQPPSQAATTSAFVTPLQRHTVVLDGMVVGEPGWSSGAPTRSWSGSGGTMPGRSSCTASRAASSGEPTHVIPTSVPCRTTTST